MGITEVKLEMILKHVPLKSWNWVTSKGVILGTNRHKRPIHALCDNISINSQEGQSELSAIDTQNLIEAALLQ